VSPFATIGELHDAYRTGAATPAAIVEAHLARIERLKSELAAFTEVDRAGALAAAAKARRDAPRPLEGVPVAVKSNIAVQGLEWNAGMAARRGMIADADAEAVRRLRDAGAILLGTLNMQEAALGATTDNPWFGRGFNPHGQGRTPGGSSGGSGSAVAAGLCVASLGTDTLGSIRIPAAYNGVYGLKPTNGAVSNQGLAPLSAWLDCIGPLARSLDDLELVFSVLHPFASSKVEKPAPATRLLTLADLAGVECEPAVLAGYQRALAVLDDLPRGEFRLSEPPRFLRVAGFVDSAREFIRHLGPDWRGLELGVELRGHLEFAEARDDARLARDRSTLERARAELRVAIGPGAVLLMPTAPQAAFAQGGEIPVSQADFCALANVAGLPALSLPAGLDPDGMPVAVQLVGAPGSEPLLLTVARRVDAALRAYAPPPID
jgi:aspartyl-tRNA(Asn)/glutamyl-tRNA(Gln) amidotransferase subunit A